MKFFVKQKPFCSLPYLSYTACYMMESSLELNPQQQDLSKPHKPNKEEFSTLFLHVPTGNHSLKMKLNRLRLPISYKLQEGKIPHIPQ